MSRLPPTRIDGRTRLIGLIGWPVGHSFSPAMHNAAARQLRLNWIYVPLPVPPRDLQAALAGLAALGFAGVNVTVPHKQAVLPFLDAFEEGARAIGAVNTIVIDRSGTENIGARLAGYNTDWRGFLDDLAAQSVAIAERDCLILGAGGSARAVIYGLLQEGARVRVLARRLEQAQALAAAFDGVGAIQAMALADLGRAAGDLRAPLIVNSTPVGMAPHSDASPWPVDVPFPAGSFVYDLVYNPPTTRLLRQAAAAGCRTSNGLGMLVHQGVRAFALWTGREPDISVMRRALSLS